MTDSDQGRKPDRRPAVRAAGATSTRRPSPAVAASPPSRPLERPTLANMTLVAIRDRILGGAYPEGEPLRQDAIADELGVSRIPVREALRQLEAEGLVSFHPHRGAVVSSLSLAEIEEVFSLRANIEAGLLRAAVPLLGDDHLGHAHEVLRRYDRALRARNVVAYGELNWQFHSTLYAPADRPVAMGIVQRLHRQADRYLRMQLVLTHSEHRSREEHHAILDAASEGDAKASVALLREHIMSAGRVLVRFLRDYRAGVAEPPRRAPRRRAAAGRE